MEQTTPPAPMPATPTISTTPAPAAPVVPVYPAYKPPAKPARPLRASKPADKRGWWWGTGRRKTAVARVRLRPAKDGDAKVVVCRSDRAIKTIAEYFAEERDRNDACAPLKATNTEGKFEIVIRAHGGGSMGQAQAVKLGVARALLGYDPTLETILRDQGMLTRDAREVERKKYGQAGARRRFQFSKR